MANSVLIRTDISHLSQNITFTVHRGRIAAVGFEMVISSNKSQPMIGGIFKHIWIDFHFSLILV